MTTSPGASRWAVNPGRDHAWTCRPAPATIRDFHRNLPGYAPTRLAALPELARAFGVARVYAKDESNRLGLPAFKALGASWAIHQTLRQRTLTRPVTLVTGDGDGTDQVRTSSGSPRPARSSCSPPKEPSLMRVDDLGQARLREHDVGRGAPPYAHRERGHRVSRPAAPP